MSYQPVSTNERQLSPDQQVLLREHKRSKFIRIVLAAASLTAFLLLSALFLSSDTVQKREGIIDWKQRLSNSLSTDKAGLKLHPLRKVIKDGPITGSFREMLIPEDRYILGKGSNGLSNQLIALVNQIYLGKLTRRVPILSAMSPNTNLDAEKEDQWDRWSNYFDLERFQRETGIPLIELDQIAHNQTHDPKPVRQNVACWSTREVRSGTHATSGALGWNGLQLHHWPLPSHIESWQNNRLAASALVSFDLAYNKQKWIDTLSSGSSKSDRMMPPPSSAVPDDQLLCFDDYYYITTNEAQNAAFDDVALYGQMKKPFTEIGQYLHFHPRIEAMLDDIVKSLFGSRDAKYLAVHIRHGDFGDQFTVPMFEEKMAQLQDILSSPGEDGSAPLFPGANELPVLVVTNDESPELRANLKSIHWRHYEHSKSPTTTQAQSVWLAPIIDSALLARSQGLIGTTHSTYSLLAALRVQAWQGNPSLFIGDKVDF